MLSRTDFTAEMLDLVRDLDCGSAPWQQEVAEWIKLPAGEGGALDAMAQYGTSVWLYSTDEGEVVGYGSLGESKWPWPTASSPRVKNHHVPFMGVRREFQHRPTDAERENRYSYQIFRNLVFEAQKRPELARVITLFVHPENFQAIRFYERFGFRPYEHYSNGYQGMSLEF